MYFFSQIDPNYRIKGSRDPLGFQSLWAAAGHRVVAHLSTVSSNLRDFMILVYAHYFYGSKPENRFINFFLKFEQVCAYARRIHLQEEGFNGIDFVNKRKDNEPFTISLNPSDMLLSNQRAYGIYGKYIRPTRDMRLATTENFNNIMDQSLEKTDKPAILKIIENLMENNESKFSKEELKPLAELLKNLTSEEKEFYRNHILKTSEPNHPQNNLYELIKKNNHIAKWEFNLHETIHCIQNLEGISDELKAALENIIQTDKVLFPLNRCFLHLLSQTQWTEQQIKDDAFINNLPKPVDYTFPDPIMQKMNAILSFDSIAKVDSLIERNKSVKKGGRPWIIKEKNLYKVIFGENGQKQKEIDYAKEYEFSYFISTWLNLYKQIELIQWNNL